MASYKLPFWLIMLVLGTICALVFTPGLLMLAYGHTLVEWPTKFTASSLFLHYMQSVTTSIFVLLAIIWYIDWGYSTLIRVYGSILNRVEIAK